ncbi:hypothetical protein WH35_01895 [Wolbachia endosymbiont of Drosophila incompta]|nr:hypothetical protein WH35_01895 [Wolbachia endosymbiont of Drosophila incompta]
MTTAKKRKLPSDFHDVEVGIKRPRISGQEITLLNSNPYPDNFYVGQAIGNGSCFFDSFRQSLEQQTGEQVTAEKLRNDCREFAQKNPPKWFTNAIVNSHDNNGQHRSETVDDYTADIMRNSRWGDPDVEGRILCEKYKVKLHVIENQTVDNQDLSLHELIDNSGSKSAGEYNKVDYGDSSTVHIINKGGLHFEPLLDRNKSSAKQLQEETRFPISKKTAARRDLRIL